jgi:threonine aldolase
VLDGDVATGPTDEMLSARLVCDWSMTDSVIDQFLSHF